MGKKFIEEEEIIQAHKKHEEMIISYNETVIEALEKTKTFVPLIEPMSYIEYKILYLQCTGASIKEKKR